MTEAMRAHLRLLESDLPRRTHYRKDTVHAKQGGACSRPPDAIANQRRAFIAANMHRSNEGLAAELGITDIAVRKHKRRIRAGELQVVMGAKLRKPE
jgi:hypothetical protein